MRVEFTEAVFVGTRTHAAGEVAELADEQARRVVAAGQAKPMREEQPAPETGELPDAGGDERATLTPPRPQRKRRAG